MQQVERIDGEDVERQPKQSRPDVACRQRPAAQSLQLASHQVRDHPLERLPVLPPLQGSGRCVRGRHVVSAAPA